MNNNFVETKNVNLSELRYFTSSDIEDIFDIIDVNDEIVINFANREVISLNGVKVNGVRRYVENGLHK